MFFSIVIPMYNEKTVAESCARELSDKLEDSASVLSFSYEIIFSDDGSSDGCGDIIREFAEKYPLKYGKINVVTSDKNCGKGSAVRLGILASSGDYVLFTDSDLAYGSEICVNMLMKLLSSYADVLIGSRAIADDGYAGYTFMRKIASKTYVKLLSIAAGFSHSDSQCGIKAFRGDSARKIFSFCEVNGWAFDFEVLMIAERAGYIIEEYPVRVINHRESKVRVVSDSIKMMRDVRKIKKRVNKLNIC